MAVSAALAWEHEPPRGLLVDVTELDYFGGDTLISWDHLLERGEGSTGPCLAWPSLCRRQNLGHVRSLIEEFTDATAVQTFVDEDEAVRVQYEGCDSP